MLSASSSNSVEGGLLVETFGPVNPPDVDGALVKDFLGLVLDVFRGLVVPPVLAVVLAEPVMGAGLASDPFCCAASAGLGNWALKLLPD